MAKQSNAFGGVDLLGPQAVSGPQSAPKGLGSDALSQIGDLVSGRGQALEPTDSLDALGPVPLSEIKSDIDQTFQVDTNKLTARNQQAANLRKGSAVASVGAAAVSAGLGIAANSREVNDRLAENMRQEGIVMDKLQQRFASFNFSKRLRAVNRDTQIARRNIEAIRRLEQQATPDSSGGQRQVSLTDPITGAQL